MTPREPDRFEAKAREIVDLFVTTGTHVTEMRSSLAVALRTAESSALERAAHRLEEIARDYEGRKLRSLATDETVEAAFLEQMGRAAWRCVKAVYELKSPAAAPAAEVKVNACQVDLRTDKDRECFDDIVQAATRVLRSEPVTPAPLLPRVLAALDHVTDPDAMVVPAEYRAIAAELRAYIAKAKGEGT